MTICSENLHRLVIERRLRHPGVAELNRHVSNVVAKPPPRGWRLVKSADGSQIDAVVALAMPRCAARSSSTTAWSSRPERAGRFLTVILAQAQQAADHTPAWLAFAGALAVAIIAAMTAHLRQRAELTAERDRLDDQLAAERDRHAERLEHERSLNDLEELRTVLDAAAAQLATTFIAFGDIGVLHGREEYMAARDTVLAYHQAVINGVRQKERLTVRLGREHPVTLAYDATLDALNEGYRFVRMAALEDRRDTEAERREFLDAAGERSDAFSDAAYELIASRLPSR
jgi:hypothetical protein